jgi:hypothetical protein
VRRWESGAAKPTEADVTHFAVVCNLRPIETRFLIEGLASLEIEEPPDEALFTEWARDVLSHEIPAYIFDSLFYVRASNNFREIILSGPHFQRRLQENILTYFLKMPGFKERNPGLEMRFKRWLRDFWSSTACLCGSPAYRRLLSELGEFGGFEDRWRGLVLRSDEYSWEPIGTPRRWYFPEAGEYLSITTSVTLPPTYHLRQYIPMDDLARARVESVRNAGPTKVLIHPQVHWNQPAGVLGADLVGG